MPSACPEVSVIISTYNRFDAFLLCLQSVQKQTYKHIQIIVVNDGSDDERYYDVKQRPKDVIWIDLEKNSKEIFGFPCPGFVRNEGIKKMSGTYYATLDDDDYWFPNKIEAQLNAMKVVNAKISATEAVVGFGQYDYSKRYPFLYHRHFQRKAYMRASKAHHFDWDTGKLPLFFDDKITKSGNFVIHSSILIDRQLLEEVGGYREMMMHEEVKKKKRAMAEDWDLWQRILMKTDHKILNIDQPLLYYQLKNTRKNRKAYLKRYFLKWYLMFFK